MEIEGYEDYLIYDDGRVFSKKRNIFKKHNNHRNGYLQIVLCKNGKCKTFLIHRLVALHYVNNPHPDKYNIVDHLDRNKKHNNRTNLRWCNQAINMSNQSIHKNNKLGEQFISYRPDRNTYRFEITRNKIRYTKQLKTLEEAISYRDNFLLLQQQEQ